VPRPLIDLLKEKLGTSAVPRFNPLGVTSIGLTATRILAPNPNRYSWSFVNLSSANIYLHLDNSVSTTRGWLVGPNGGSLSANWEEDLELVSNDWFAVGSGAALSFLVYEVESAGS
jgi:hypothetical protein